MTTYRIQSKILFNNRNLPIRKDKTMDREVQELDALRRYVRIGAILITLAFLILAITLLPELANTKQRIFVVVSVTALVVYAGLSYGKAHSGWHFFCGMAIASSLMLLIIQVNLYDQETTEVNAVVWSYCEDIHEINLDPGKQISFGSMEYTSLSDGKVNFFHNMDKSLVVYIDETDFVRYNLVEGEVYSISIVYDVKSFFCDNNQPDGIYYRAIELVILP